MAAISATAVGNKGILANRIVIDMADTIGFLEPSANPLVVLTKKLNTKACSNPKYEWMDNDLDVRWSSAGANANADATTIVVATGEGKYFTPGDLFKFVKTGEIIQVSTVTTDTLTVVRNIGSVAATAAAITKDDKFLIIGNASMQGSGAPAENVVGVTPYYNYTQIFKTAFSTTNTLEATQLYGMKELARLRKMAGIRHAKSMEYAFLFGGKSLNTAGAQNLTTTEGIVTSLANCANNDTKTWNAATVGDLLKFCENIFTYGGSERTCLCSPDVLSWFAEKAGDKLHLVQSDMDKTFGLNITKYMTPHGVLNLVLHPLLVNGYGGYMIALDMGDLYYRPLQGRDTKLKTNVQLPDEDGQRDMYITEAGVQLDMVLKHGIFTFTDS